MNLVPLTRTILDTVNDHTGGTLAAEVTALRAGGATVDDVFLYLREQDIHCSRSSVGRWLKTLAVPK